MADECEELLHSYIDFVEKLVNNPHIGYMVWCDTALVEEYKKLKERVNG